METTFMTIHNLSPEANILYASDSITQILGYAPIEVTGRSCFDYFHPDEVPFARNVHSRGVKLDKAAVLHYARVRGRDGSWIGCECVFTIVYEVLVACTSIYRGDEKNERRAIEAPAIRRLFTSSPRDPRYHMLEHLSSKFRSPPQPSLLEPRAALILNRFSETLPVMYATKTVYEVLGVSAEVLDGKSFYECIQEQCLREAIRCLESAKANDSIAYLRFWRRDPRLEAEIEEERMREASQSSDSEDGGVELSNRMDLDPDPIRVGSFQPESSHEASSGSEHHHLEGSASTSRHDYSRTPSAESAHIQGSNATIFDHAEPSRSSSSSLAPLPAPRRENRARSAARVAPEPYELEAVVSCTSDGLVVILRRARPLVPAFGEQPIAPNLGNGMFAAPWGVNPVHPHVYQPNQQVPFVHGFQAPLVPVGGPPMNEFMSTIRDIAVFAWSLVGINGNIASYGHGQPRGEAQPPGGIPVWDPYAQPIPNYLGPDNQAAPRWERWAREKPQGQLYSHRLPYPQRQPGNLLHQAEYGADHHIAPGASMGNRSPTNLPTTQPPNGMRQGSNLNWFPWN